MRVKQSHYGISCWIQETHFINTCIERIQSKLNEQSIDIRLSYYDRCSFPNKYWAVEIPYKTVVTSDTFNSGKLVKDFLANQDTVLKQFTPALIEQTVKIINKCSHFEAKPLTISVSYALVEKCCKNNSNGVIIFWCKS